MEKESNIENLDKKKKDKIEHLFLHELFFLIRFFFYLIKTPFLLIFYLFKGKPLYAFNPLKSLISEEIRNQKAIFTLIALNILVFFLFYFFIFLDILFNSDFFLDLWKLIFISSKENYYLFNLSFLAHFNVKHFLINIIFLYYLAYILNFKGFDVIKLYFVFGFLENLSLFFLSFFMEIPDNLGASGVISAFLIISLIVYPFAFSIFFLLLYYLLFFDYFPIYFLNIFNLASILEDVFLIGKLRLTEEQIFVFSHFLGYLQGSVYLLIFKYKDLSKLKRFILILLIFALILLLIRLFISI